ncbi:Glucose-methanol-choline oxidoreductase C-terminal [Penicillium paradoxum]|uniref:Glucose-methanol-choline oxidoreductase C-terminal n=1 Tax=Penicillium paradoxum TaxID=176176 RepID=UPI00254965CF|nr:Glucose-methanol-choline oxidoreductase C-terminal [Penicillium paradoxum]KAJ5794013.1 Glucose-methanol-choline oxidoreductase C-terminal [Penicillium paradoxum]
MLFSRLLGVAALSAVVKAVELSGYEYVVVGSGAGGGPLAARLALAGHSTLLIEAGDDQGANLNYTVPAFSAKASEDEALAWNFYVKHYADESRQKLDFKTTYETPDGKEYTGLNPPVGSKMKGTLYPRTGTLGGCTAHNALVTVYPHDSDFEYLATLTGDGSWSPKNMRKYFKRMENNKYLLPLLKGHGYDGWLGTETAPLDIVLKDPQLLSLLLGGAFSLGNVTHSIFNIGTLLAGDANSDSKHRDTSPGYYQVPLASDGASRNGPREFVTTVRDAKNADGTKRFPLDIRMNCHVTKITFDESVNPPRATGVEFLDGQYLYSASPRSKTAGKGKPGSATASREVIVSGGAYNSPQILKLSGIGPAEELQNFGIKVIANLPGVGTNLQDHYETVVQGHTPKDLASFDGCTFNNGDDPCLDRWEKPVLGNRGIYSSNGFAAAMLYKSTVTADNGYDVFVFGGPINFRGYYPGYGVNITERHDWFSWAVLKAHPRNTAGSVMLRSADPLDMPEIVFNYFDTGSGDYGKDLQAITEGIHLARGAFDRQVVDIDEVLPGGDVQTDKEIHDYIKNTAWGHHASCTCPIGPDGDPFAVLDSDFQVRGVSGLRVVDASVYPRIPGTFTAVSTFLVGEKAADVILQAAKASE